MQNCQLIVTLETGRHIHRLVSAYLIQLKSNLILKMKKFIISLLGMFLCLGAFAGPNPSTMYFGWDWISPDNTPMEIPIRILNSSGPASTNLNIVHHIDSLNSPQCANEKCAFSIGIADNTHTRFNICPGATNYTECMNQNPWANIWNAVDKIARANNRPAAIYFLDEPSIHRAAQELPSIFRVNGQYVQWTYSSFVCTLREAMQAYKVNYPVFTILAMGELGGQDSIVHEINNQMPQSGCPSGVRSMPDAIGIDNYYWRTEAGVCSDSNTIYQIYNQYFPRGGNRPMWVLVPPGSLFIDGYEEITDQAFRDHVQVYWDVMAEYPNAPITGVMAFRFDQRVMDINSQRKLPMTRDLLRFIGNSIVDGPRPSGLVYDNPSPLPACPAKLTNKG